MQAKLAYIVITKGQSEKLFTASIILFPALRFEFTGIFASGCKISWVWLTKFPGVDILFFNHQYICNYYFAVAE